MQINKTRYKQKYKRCIGRLDMKRVKELIERNKEHLKNSNERDQVMINIELEQLRKKRDQLKGEQETLK